MFSPIVTINTSALEYNFNKLKAITGSMPVMVMIKADAYGHGSLEIAKLFSSADYFGVARLSEAKELIEVGIKNKLVLMEGFFDASEFEYCIKHSIDFVIHQDWQLQLIESHTYISKDINIWIKVNTGMNRLGFKCIEIPSIYQSLGKILSNKINFITHFFEADNASSLQTEIQNSLFLSTLGKLDGQYGVSVANSAAIINFPSSRYGIARLGISVYGSNFQGEHMGVNLRPAMSLHSKVIAINDYKALDIVGYAGTWSSSESTRLAVVAIGYGDGYPRNAQNGTPVFIRNKRYSIVGRVSMDMLVVNIEDDEILIGDEVELWGDNISISEVAKSSDTIPYELMCGLTKRVKRLYK